MENGIKLKVYTMEDQLFCWGAVVIAESKEAACELWNSRPDTSGVTPADLEEHKLEGFMFEAGGNG